MFALSGSKTPISDMNERYIPHQLVSSRFMFEGNTIRSEATPDELGAFYRYLAAISHRS
jgi:hypothetical protein